MKNVCKFISGADVDSLREGKSNHEKAKACEVFLGRFRSHYDQAFQSLDDTGRTRIEALLDSQAMRILMGRRCKHATYEALAKSLHQELQDLLQFLQGQM